jgi:hypothetical protein
LSTVLSLSEVDIDDDFKCDMCGCNVDARELKTPSGERLAADKFHGDETYRVAR